MRSIPKSSRYNRRVAYFDIEGRNRPHGLCYIELKNDWELMANFANGEIVPRQANCTLRKSELQEYNGEIIINAINEGIFIDKKQRMIRFSLVTGKVFE